MGVALETAMPKITPEEFDALPTLTHGDVVNGSPAYFARIKAQLPVFAPKYRAGDMVYCYHFKMNVRVTYVHWDPGFMSASFWRVVVPGWSGQECNVAEYRPGVATQAA